MWIGQAGWTWSFPSDDGETWSAPQTVVEGPDDDRKPGPWCGGRRNPGAGLRDHEGIWPGRQAAAGVDRRRLRDSGPPIRGRRGGRPPRSTSSPRKTSLPTARSSTSKTAGLLMHIYAEDDLLDVGAKEGRYYALRFSFLGRWQDLGRLFVPLRWVRRGRFPADERKENLGGHARRRSLRGRHPSH